MNIIKIHLILAMSALFISSGYSAANGIQIDEAITAEQSKMAIAFAKEFGINKIQCIAIPHNLSKYEDRIVVRGDEHLEGGIGRFKEVVISFWHTRFDAEQYSHISPRLSACEMQIVKFVELEIEGRKRRVCTQNVNPEIALKILTKIHTLKFTRAPCVDAKAHPGEESMGKPESLELWYDGITHFYRYSLMSNEEIDFTIEDGNIVIQGYGRHVH